MIVSHSSPTSPTLRRVFLAPAHLPPYAALMDRYAMNDGTTVEVLAELEQLRADRAAQSAERAAPYEAAIEKIKAGEDAVRIGDRAWRVVDWADV